MLWELLRCSKPTLNLFVRLCATTPYLASILIENPGMIDELADSLLMNQLPSGDRLDAHRASNFAAVTSDILRVLNEFKNSAHLTIGVRDMLGKDTIESTHAAISNTAEACLRRVIEHEQEIAADRFGDPMTEAESGSQQVPAEMIAVALGKLGGREPNYHSDLEILMLYSGDGETQRRIGGHLHTTTNHLFFNQVARQVNERLGEVGSAGRLYELHSRLNAIGEEGVLSTTFDAFLDTFRRDQVPLSRWLALGKARVISGSIRQRSSYQEKILDTLATFQWNPSMTDEIQQMRRRMQDAAAPSNLKRGEGGTVDVEWIAQVMMLKHVSGNPSMIRQGTIDSLLTLEKLGHLSHEDASTLVRGYRILRRTEANLRLMNAEGRHELPEDEKQMKNLAYLMGQPNADSVRQMCNAARKSNRKLFDQI